MIRNEMIPVKLGGLSDSGESEGKTMARQKQRRRQRQTLDLVQQPGISRCLVIDRKLNGETKCRKDNNRLEN